MKIRGMFILACLVAAFVAATCKVANAQAVNPRFLEFSSQDHSAVGTYRVCFYPSATSTTPARCNDVPVAAAVFQSGTTYRIPRAAWETNLTPGTDYWPKVRAIGSNGVESVGEVGPTTTPFFFRLLPAPRDVTGVILVP